MREGTKPDIETTKGLVAQFAYWLEKEGYKSSGYLHRVRRLARLGANLLDPEDVKKVIAEQPWKDSVKLYTVCAYDAMTEMLGITWKPPKYKSEESLPFIPEEEELDQLIAACKSRRMAAYLQTLKETFADPGEALRIEWIDINFKNKAISINHPVKGHNPRQLQVSTKLLAMLNVLPKKSKRVFPTNYENIVTCFRTQKKTRSHPTKPKTTGDPFHHIQTLGRDHDRSLHSRQRPSRQESSRPQNIQNTMKYIHMIHFKDDEFEVAIATTVEEVKELAGAGFEKVDEIQGFHVFRKPKRFAGYS